MEREPHGHQRHAYCRGELERHPLRHSPGDDSTDRGILGETPVSRSLGGVAFDGAQDAIANLDVVAAQVANRDHLPRDIASERYSGCWRQI